MANAAPVRKLINMVLLMAIRDQASDIHFEPFEDEYKMRYRCDGVLYEMVPPPRHLATAIASRIKVMSNLDIAERRLPQDGRIELNVGGNQVDMRVSILPTMFGESVVIRVLDRTGSGWSLDRIGMPNGHPGRIPRADPQAERHRARDRADRVRQDDHALLGPERTERRSTRRSSRPRTRSSTRSTASCSARSTHEIGMTFASALRAILRQDPDKILVGEIRDLETAQIAIQAALTGHMVFSTLHTNDAPSTITRLRDMGVEPFLITATVEGILAQRLVRKICQECRTPLEPTREQLMELSLSAEQAKKHEVLLRRGLRQVQQPRLQGPVGVVRTAHHQRRRARPDLEGGLDGQAAGVLPRSRG